MENFNKRTTARLAIAFLTFAIGWVLIVEWMGKPIDPPAHYELHIQRSA